MITAEHFIERVIANTIAFKWTEKEILENVKLALEDQAQIWLDLYLKEYKRPGWKRTKKAFLEEFQRNQNGETAWEEALKNCPEARKQRQEEEAQILYNQANEMPFGEEKLQALIRYAEHRIFQWQTPRERVERILGTTDLKEYVSWQTSLKIAMSRSRTFVSLLPLSTELLENQMASSLALMLEEDGTGKEVPVFWGEPKKDQIHPKDFIQMLDAHQEQHQWSDQQTLRRMKNHLRGNAYDWFMLRQKRTYQLSWSNYKRMFLSSFNQETYKPQHDRNSGERILKEHKEFCDWTKKFDGPKNPLTVGGITCASIPFGKTSNEEKKDYSVKTEEKEAETLFPFSGECQKVTALVQTSIIDRNMCRPNQPWTDKEAFQKFERAMQGQAQEWIRLWKKENASRKWTSIRQTFLDHFKRPWNANRHWNTKPNGFRKFTDSPQPGRRQEGEKFCLYCKKGGHIQEDCRHRIENNHPCLTQMGKPYWPKVHKKKPAFPASTYDDLVFL